MFGRFTENISVGNIRRGIITVSDILELTNFKFLESCGVGGAFSA
jgi:hypothetical protein